MADSGSDQPRADQRAGGPGQGCGLHLEYDGNYQKILSYYVCDLVHLVSSFSGFTWKIDTEDQREIVRPIRKLFPWSKVGRSN